MNFKNWKLGTLYTVRALIHILALRKKKIAPGSVSGRSQTSQFPWCVAYSIYIVLGIDHD